MNVQLVRANVGRFRTRSGRGANEVQTRSKMSQTAAPVQKSNLEDLFKSASLPACLIGRCCSCFGSWIVLIPLLLYFCTPLLLYSFLPSSRSTTLVVPVANDTAYSITVVYKYSSQDAHGTDQPVLIGYAFHWLFKHALATQAVSELCLRLFFSQAST